MVDETREANPEGVEFPYPSMFNPFRVGLSIGYEQEYMIKFMERAGYSFLAEALRSIILIPGTGSVVTTRIARAN